MVLTLYVQSAPTRRSLGALFSSDNVLLGGPKRARFSGALKRQKSGQIRQTAGLPFEPKLLGISPSGGPAKWRNGWSLNELDGRHFGPGRKLAKCTRRRNCSGRKWTPEPRDRGDPSLSSSVIDEFRRGSVRKREAAQWALSCALRVAGDALVWQPETSSGRLPRVSKAAPSGGPLTPAVWLRAGDSCRWSGI